jgi:hypothetical protein
MSVIKEMTWDKNIYLGSDIAVLRPEIKDVFRLLDHFDIAVAHAPVRINASAGNDYKLAELPECFPEMNCDLIAYRRSDSLALFFPNGKKLFD